VSIGTEQEGEVVTMGYDSYVAASYRPPVPYICVYTS